MYFATYQSIAEDTNRPGRYKEFAPDFFDLIVVDECHRGSAREDSNWREILEYFKPATQLGMTATPLRKDNKATYRYFGNPIYQYSLKEGLDDGFLAPYRVHRVVTSADAAGWRPTKGELDKLGREIPDEEYHTPDFEKRLSLRPRSKAIAKHLTDFLKRTNRHDRTIVFCVDQPHADEMRELLNNLNKDLVKKNPNYVCRVTSDEGAIGKGHLSAFQELEADDETPVILTTSQLLSTGVDAPMIKNVVLIRIIGTMTEFKQIIGRGTRLREDYGKLYFNIIDYTGTATRHFADKEFDGDPEFVSEEEIDEDGNVTESTVITGDEEEPEDGEDTDGEEIEPAGDDPDTGGVIIEPPGWKESPGKFFVEKGHVDISAHITLDIDADGKQLRVTEFRDYTGDFVRTYFSGIDDFRSAWSDPASRQEIINKFSDRGFDIREAGEVFNNPEADPFDILCNVAWNAPVMTRAERAARVRKNQTGFLEQHGEQAREILIALLDKYAVHGPSEFSIPESLKIPPLSDLGNVSEIVSRFGGAEEFRDAVIKLQKILYAA